MMSGLLLHILQEGHQGHGGEGDERGEEERENNCTTVHNCVHLVLDNEFTLWGLRAQEYRLYLTTIIIYALKVLILL